MALCLSCYEGSRNINFVSILSVVLVHDVLHATNFPALNAPNISRTSEELFPPGPLVHPFPESMGPHMCTDSIQAQGCPCPLVIS